MKPELDPLPDDSDAMNMFRRGTNWLRKSKIGHQGKKAKRLLHRRYRHQTRHELRQTLASL